MEEVLTRLALFTVLPVLLGASVVLFDRTAVGPVRRAEAFLIPLFLVGVGGSGISGFIANVFIPHPVATSIGWAPDGPFRYEVGFANLAIGLLGAVAAERRDGFREASVVAAMVFGIGAALAHLMGMMATGNLALGNALQAISSVGAPALLIWFLALSRRAERAEPPTVVLRGWMIPLRRGSVAAVAVAATAFPIGYATGQVTASSLAGVVAAAAFWWIVSRAPTHRGGIA